MAKVLRIIIQKPDLKVIKSETQADMKRLVGARSICLDVLGEDDNGRQYDMYDSDMTKATRHFKEKIKEVDNMCEAIENLVNRRAEERAEKMTEEKEKEIAKVTALSLEEVNELVGSRTAL